MNPVARTDALLGVFAPPIHAPFVSREWARYISTLARRILIRSNEPLPSELLKSEQLSALPTGSARASSAERCGAQPIVERGGAGTAVLQVCGGAGRDRTDDLLLAKQALSQLSYSPV